MSGPCSAPWDTIGATAIGVVSAVLGILLATVTGSPAGPLIILVRTGIFLLNPPLREVTFPARPVTFGWLMRICSWLACARNRERQRFVLCDCIGLWQLQCSVADPRFEAGHQSIPKITAELPRPAQRIPR